MISLSDIPLADIGEYMEQYGGYLFGFSRQWVIKNGFNPVWYCEKDLAAINKHKELLKNASIGASKNASYNSHVALLYYYASFMKDIEGELYVKSKNCTYTNYRFYDEREYRFVPDYDSLKNENIAPVLIEEKYNKYKESNGNSRIDKKISFSLEDLEIIIVKTDNQVRVLREYLTKKKISSIHVFSHKEIKQNIIGTGHQIIKAPSEK